MKYCLIFILMVGSVCLAKAVSNGRIPTHYHCTNSTAADGTKYMACSPICGHYLDCNAKSSADYANQGWTCTGKTQASCTCEIDGSTVKNCSHPPKTSKATHKTPSEPLK